MTLWNRVKELADNLRGIPNDAIIIVVVGPTGSGRSTFINSAVGSEQCDASGNATRRNNPNATSLDPITKSFQRVHHRRGSQKFVFVDTPGLDVEDIRPAAYARSAKLPSGRTVNAVIYLHRINLPRVTTSPKDHIALFKMLCGDNWADKLIVATTMWRMHNTPFLPTHYAEGFDLLTTLDNIYTGYWTHIRYALGHSKSLRQNASNFIENRSLSGSQLEGHTSNSSADPVHEGNDTKASSARDRKKTASSTQTKIMDGTESSSDASESYRRNFEGKHPRGSQTDPKQTTSPTAFAETSASNHYLSKSDDHHSTTLDGSNSPPIALTQGPNETQGKNTNTVYPNTLSTAQPIVGEVTSGAPSSPGLSTDQTHAPHIAHKVAERERPAFPSSISNGDNLTAHHTITKVVSKVPSPQVSSMDHSRFSPKDTPQMVVDRAHEPPPPSSYDEPIDIAGVTHESSSSSSSEEFVDAEGQVDARESTKNVYEVQHANIENVPPEVTVAPEPKACNTKKMTLAATHESKKIIAFNNVPDQDAETEALSRSACLETSYTSREQLITPSDSPAEILEGQQNPPSNVVTALQSQINNQVAPRTITTIPQSKSWSHKLASMTRGRVGKSASSVRKGTVTQVQTVDLNKDDVIIAVMGPTGTGKSSFINMVTGTDGDKGVGHDLESCTNEIKILKFQCLERSIQDIAFVDTPGFDDTHKSDIEILNLIADWLKTTYEQEVQLSGILYFHRISDNRMAGTPLKNLHMFEKLCGKDALGNIVLTTTMWDDVDEETGLQREKELQKNYWKGMINQGSRTVRYLNDEESAWEIVDYIVGPKNDSFAVELQHELVDLHEQLPETGAGRELYGKLQSLVSRQQDTLQRLRASMKRQEEPVILDALKEEYEELRKQLEATVRDMEALKIPIGTRLRRFFTIKLGFFNRKKFDAH
ncbi:hypothetical protein ONZ45_g5026 [Pleurotus djamor]|nr:hypothetical protein ONZ45_g5026 [Pleurotus djamor]